MCQLAPGMRKFISALVFLLALMAPTSAAQAQEADGGGGNSAGISKKQFEKANAKKERKAKKEAKRKERRDMKEHLSHQDKATRKRMKHNKKGADNHGPHAQRPGFFRRLFTKH
jgi:hypothetical protein